MKKIFASIFLSFLFTSTAMAATIVSEYSVSMEQYEVRALAPVLITSTSDGDITSEHGIHIMLGENDRTLFDKRDLQFTGAAIDNGRVNLNVESVFMNGYKVLYIPVQENFEAGDWLSIQGLAIRAYDDPIGSEYLEMDLDGDFEMDVLDETKYEILNDERNDRTAPYPLTEVDYMLNADGSVEFTWNKPPDYDFSRALINRTRIKNGFSLTSTVYDDSSEYFTDQDLKDVSFATYELHAVDKNGNQGEPEVVEIDFTMPAEEPVEEPEVPVEEPVEEPVDVPEDEVEQLSRLINYYNVRYSIKCMPSGVEVAENNSACLWARIDLIYAQDLTGEDKVAGLALSERDLELMETRRRWPELRYEDNCIMAAEPATYCPALGKALDRISYFLD